MIVISLRKCGRGGGNALVIKLCANIVTMWGDFLSASKLTEAVTVDHGLGLKTCAPCHYQLLS